MKTPDYRAAHRYVRKKRGKPESHACLCGKRPAKEWAFVRPKDDREILVDERGRPYSLNVWHYQPMCRPCHRNYDAMHG